MFTLSTPAEKRPYHHRDLRQALIRSALEILSEAGVAGLSLRAAARRAGASAMAPIVISRTRKRYLRLSPNTASGNLPPG